MAKKNKSDWKLPIDKDNQSVTPQPQFSINELNAKREKALALINDPTTPKDHKFVYKVGLEKLQEEIANRAFSEWFVSDVMPNEIGTSITFYAKEQINTMNRPQCEFKIDDKIDLLIKIGANNSITFLQVSTGKHNTFTIDRLGWMPIGLGVLKDIATTQVSKPKGNKQSVSNQVKQINDDIQFMTGLKTRPIQYDRKLKRRISKVAITMYDANDNYIDINKKVDNQVGIKYGDEFDDQNVYDKTNEDYHGNASQSFLYDKYGNRNEDEDEY